MGRSLRVLGALLARVHIICVGLMILCIAPGGVCAETLHEINIKGLDRGLVQKLKTLPGASFWIEVDDRLVVMGKDDFVKALGGEFAIKKLPIKHGRNLFFSFGASKKHLEEMGLEVIAFGGRAALVGSRHQSLPKGDHHVAFRKFEPNVVLSGRLPRLEGVKKESLQDPETLKALNGIDLKSWQDDVNSMTNLGRYSLDEQGMKATVAWLVTRLSHIRGMELVTQSFDLNKGKASNIIARWRGRAQKPSELFVVGAHYDAISEEPMKKAPGAEDNASGVAALIELARVCALLKLPVNIDFVAFGGEEQGLLGSYAYVKELLNGSKVNIKSVLTMDMIAFSSDDEFDVLIETSKTNEGLVDEYHRMAFAYTSLSMFRTYYYWGSDHVPFLEKGMPAVLVIENDYGDYPAYHSTKDLMSNLNEDQALEVLKLNLAMLVTWSKG